MKAPPILVTITILSLSPLSHLTMEAQDQTPAQFNAKPLDPSEEGKQAGWLDKIGDSKPNSGARLAICSVWYDEAVRNKVLYETDKQAEAEKSKEKWHGLLPKYSDGTTKKVRAELSPEHIKCVEYEAPPKPKSVQNVNNPHRPDQKQAESKAAPKTQTLFTSEELGTKSTPATTTPAATPGEFATPASMVQPATFVTSRMGVLYFDLEFEGKKYRVAPTANSKPYYDPRKPYYIKGVEQPYYTEYMTLGGFTSTVFSVNRGTNEVKLIGKGIHSSPGVNLAK